MDGPCTHPNNSVVGPVAQFNKTPISLLTTVAFHLPVPIQGQQEDNDRFDLVPLFDCTEGADLASRIAGVVCHGAV